MGYGDGRICKILAGEFESHTSHKIWSVRLMVRTLGFQPKNTSSILVRTANGNDVTQVVTLVCKTSALGVVGSSPTIPTKFGPIV